MSEKIYYRFVEPRVKMSDNTAYVMWSTTGTDMQQRHWVPNHFVAVLPVDTPDVVVPIDLQRSRHMRHSKIERENLERKCSLTRDVSTIKLEHSDGVQSGKEESTETILDDTHLAETVTSENEETGDNGETDKFTGEKELSPEDVLQKYVIVKYDGALHPGYVCDIDEGGVFVRCMHRAGKNLYWSKAVVDECWYCMQNVLAVIPEPQQIRGKCNIDREIWDRNVQKDKETV